MLGKTVKSQYIMPCNYNYDDISFLHSIEKTIHQLQKSAFNYSGVFSEMLFVINYLIVSLNPF